MHGFHQPSHRGPDHPKGIPCAWKPKSAWFLLLPLPLYPQDWGYVPTTCLLVQSLKKNTMLRFVRIFVVWHAHNHATVESTKHAKFSKLAYMIVSNFMMMNHHPHHHFCCSNPCMAPDHSQRPCSSSSWLYAASACAKLSKPTLLTCVYHWYPLVNKHSELENGHRNSGFSHRKWWFSIAMLVITRG